MPSTDIHSLSLHDALPICQGLADVVTDVELRTVCLEIFNDASAEIQAGSGNRLLPMALLPGWDVDACVREVRRAKELGLRGVKDRKSTRLNSSHMSISYAVYRHPLSFPTRRSSDLSGPRRRRHRCRAAHRVPRDLQRRERGDPGRVGEPPVADGIAAGLGRRRVRTRGASREGARAARRQRSEEHTSELQSHVNLVCRLQTSTLFPYTTLFRSVRASPTSSPMSSCAPCASRSSTTRARRSRPGRGTACCRWHCCRAGTSTRAYARCVARRSSGCAASTSRPTPRTWAHRTSPTARGIRCGRRAAKPACRCTSTSVRASPR